MTAASTPTCAPRSKKRRRSAPHAFFSPKEEIKYGAGLRGLSIR